MDFSALILHIILGNGVIKGRFLGGSSGNNKKKIKNLKIGYNEKIPKNILLGFLKYG